MKRIHLIISGIVQGVGYRGWFRREAVKLGLTGWVRNREDEAVEAVCEGKEDSLLIMVKLAKQGSEVAEVSEVKAEWEVYKGEYQEFEIIN